MSFAIMTPELFQAHSEDARKAVFLHAMASGARAELSALKEIRNPQLYALCFDELKALREEITVALVESSKPASVPLKIIVGGKS